METRSKPRTRAITNHAGANLPDENDAQPLIELLTEEMQRREVELLSVRRRSGGFSVRIGTDPRSSERWYSSNEIRSFARGGLNRDDTSRVTPGTVNHAPESR